MIDQEQIQNWDEVNHGPWMETYTGKRVFPGAPSDSPICVADIAHHLAMENRYGGAFEFPYSVAQHSVLLHRYVKSVLAPPAMCKLAIIHDAPEYICKDIPRPFKQELGDRYKQIESLWDVAVRQTVPLIQMGESEYRKFKEYDLRISLDERKAGLPRSPGLWGIDHLDPLGVAIEPWHWQRARYEFMEIWHWEFGLSDEDLEWLHKFERERH